MKLSTGTIVDASIISAPSSTKNKKGERDPEMHQTKKGNQWYFGMKAPELREQILIADVCALQASVRINADKEPPDNQQNATRQLAFYATPEGQYAKGDNGRGIFTQIALDVLQEFNEWPPLKDFRDRGFPLAHPGWPQASPLPLGHALMACGIDR
jgi:hypothetical protein